MTTFKRQRFIKDEMDKMANAGIHKTDIEVREDENKVSIYILGNLHAEFNEGPDAPTSNAS